MRAVRERQVLFYGGRVSRCGIQIAARHRKVLSRSQSRGHVGARERQVACGSKRPQLDVVGVGCGKRLYRCGTGVREGAVFVDHHSTRINDGLARHGNLSAVSDRHTGKVGVARTRDGTGDRGVGFNRQGAVVGNHCTRLQIHRLDRDRAFARRRHRAFKGGLARHRDLAGVNRNGRAVGSIQRFNLSRPGRSLRHFVDIERERAGAGEVKLCGGKRAVVEVIETGHSQRACDIGRPGIGPNAACANAQAVVTAHAPAVFAADGEVFRRHRAVVGRAAREDRQIGGRQIACGFVVDAEDLAVRNRQRAAVANRAVAGEGALRDVADRENRVVFHRSCADERQFVDREFSRMVFRTVGAVAAHGELASDVGLRDREGAVAYLHFTARMRRARGIAHACNDVIEVPHRALGGTVAAQRQDRRLSAARIAR